MTFNKAAYLKRIGLDDVIPMDLAGLVTLHMAQAYTIPFENLDILLGRGIKLSSDAVFTKIIEQGRGGYCFELNGLFRLALEAFGYNVRSLLARVHINEQPSGRAHEICLVTFGEQQWLADVGFGANGIRTPIPLVAGFKSEQGGQTFKLVEDDNFGMMLRCKTSKGWQDLYSFDMCHVCQGDIEMGNHFTSTHEESIFTQMPIITLPTLEGRVTMRQDNLRIDDGTTVVDATITKVRDYHAALTNHFGLEFTSEEAAQLFAKCCA